MTNFQINEQFSKEWSTLFHKKYASYTHSGKDALKFALRLLGSKIVALPSYTCEDLLTVTLGTNCTPVIIDCGDDLQIDVEKLARFNVDTVVVPHMFGLQADIKSIRELDKFMIIEDCAQCFGLPELGIYSDIVISSFGPAKWLPVGGGGLLAHNLDKTLALAGTLRGYDKKSIEEKHTISNKLLQRTMFADELLNAGVPLITNDKPNAWFRGMYFTDTPERLPYIPLHRMYGEFDCPNVDTYEFNLDWVSIFSK